MWSFLRRQTLYFLIGFVIAFVIYLLIKIGASDVLWGLVVGAIGGLAVSIAVFFLERRFPERPGPGVEGS